MVLEQKENNIGGMSRAHEAERYRRCYLGSPSAKPRRPARRFGATRGRRSLAFVPCLFLAQGVNLPPSQHRGPLDWDENDYAYSRRGSVRPDLHGVDSRQDEMALVPPDPAATSCE